VAQHALRLVARQHPVGEIQRLRARQCGVREAFELTARRELGDDALEDAVPGEGARELLR
jgi:hypothetical protein